jgi:hypothetical protein
MPRTQAPERTARRQVRILGAVRSGGRVAAGDSVRVELAAEPHRPFRGAVSIPTADIRLLRPFSPRIRAFMDRSESQTRLTV